MWPVVLLMANITEDRHKKLTISGREKDQQKTRVLITKISTEVTIPKELVHTNIF